MYEVNSMVSNRFLSKKHEYESLNLAIKLAKQSNCKEDEVLELISMKQEAKQDYTLESSRLVDEYFNIKSKNEIGSNMLSLSGGWYGVAYLGDKRELLLKVELIIEKDLYMLERIDTLQQYSRTELETLLPAYIDETALELYKHGLNQRAMEILHDYVASYKLVEVTTPDVVEPVVRPSAHAGKRWVQRRMNVSNELQAEEYRRSHFKEVDEAIMKGFDTASKIWEGSDGISYWFDEENVMYVVGNNTIITLYEEDFGFTKEINRSIVLMQISEVEKAYETLCDKEREHDRVITGVDSSISDLNHQIAELQLRVAYLSSCKMTLSATRDQSERGIKLEREHFNNQFNKLFKKWEV